MDDLRMNIAHNISRLRVAHNMTQAELAECLNYSDKAVSKWERGESLPDILVLKQLADLFLVRVDDLFSDNAPLPDPESEKIRMRNHIIITLLATALVWLVATLVFVICGLRGDGVFKFLAYLYAVPTSAIVLLVFNSIWGRKKMNYLIISLLVWSLLVCAHLSVYLSLGVHVILIYVLGIPAQIIILLWSGLTSTRRKKEKISETEEVE